jgi:molecular chaperone HscB
MAQNQTKSGVSLIMPGQVTQACWSCGSMRAAHFCSACGKVQPPVPADYFLFFGLPRKLNLDVAALEKEFYELSRHLHPDSHAKTDPQEQEWSLQKSSQLNDAYRTLKDPIARTEYLLKLEGVPLKEQSKQASEQARATGTLKQQVVPPDLLEEVFELNLQLEELRTSEKTGASDPDLVQELEKHKAHFEERYEALLRELSKHWDHWDALLTRQQQGHAVSNEDRVKLRNKMVDLLNRRSYVRNLLRDVSEALEG